MLLIIQIIAIILGLSMFKIKSESKIGVLIATSVCLYPVSIPFIPLVPAAKDFICTCFILSEFKTIHIHYSYISNQFIGKMVGMLLLGFIIMCLASPHIKEGEIPLRYVFRSEVLLSILVPLYSYISLRDKDNMVAIIKIATISLYILTFFGLINFITQVSPFMEIVSQTRSEGNELGLQYIEDTRFRVQSMFFLACDYGYVCTALLILFMFLYSKEYISKKLLFTNILCCLFGIFICGFRTNIICLIISACCYYYFSYNLKRNAKYLLFSLLLITIAYSYLPYFQEKIDELFTVFDTNSDYRGSNIDMRLIQFAAVLNHVSDNLIFGCGFGFFNIDMGWADGKLGLVDSDLQGLEGKIMNLLLERGLIGVLLYFVFLIAIFSYAYKRRNINKISTSFILSMVILYFTYSNLTGEQGSAFISMLLIGLGLKFLDLESL